MDPGLWLRIKPLFQGALELPPAERAGFIAANAVDEPFLAERLHSMLRAHAESASVLDRSLPERLMGFAPGDDEQSSLASGQRVGGRYRLASELGHGANGVVWLARDEAVLGKAVVVKVLRSNVFAQGFDTELAALARLNHRFIASPLDSGVLDDGRRFLVLEYVDGPTLRGVLRSGPMEPMRACRLVRQIASALDAAHKQDVWHLDLKPENIMLREPGGPEEQPVLVDFGISRLGGADVPEGSPGGSLAYAPPEQLTGAPTSFSDQYSLARVAVEMITGHRPGAFEPASALISRCAALRSAVIAVLEKAMSHRPESRYSSAAVFAGELFNALDHRAAALRFRRLAAAGFCFLLVAVIGAHLWINREKENAMLQQEAQVTASQVGFVRSLLEAGYLDQRLLAETVRGAVDRLNALVNAGQRHPDVLRALFAAQMQNGLMHGHPGTLHLGSVEVGIRSIEDAIRTLRLMSQVMGEDEQYAYFSLWSRDALASLLVEAGQFERSAAIANEGLNLIDTWESARTFRRDFTHDQGSILMTLSRVSFHRKRWEECLKLRSEGVRLHRLIAQRDKNPDLLHDVAGVLAMRGHLYREMGRVDEALADYAESDSILARMQASGVKSLSNDWMAAKNRLETARTVLLRNRFTEAEFLLIDAVSRHRLLIEENPHAIPIRRTMALSLSWLATTQRALRRPPVTSNGLFTEANEIASQALARDSRNIRAREEAGFIQGQARAAGVVLPPPAPPPPPPAEP